LELKIILAPSGDHVGTLFQSALSPVLPVTPALVVICCKPLPSEFITNISVQEMPAAAITRLMKTIFSPSGDHRGMLLYDFKSVSLLRPLPSAFIIHISYLLDWLEVKAIFVPSGDQAGTPSFVPLSLEVAWISVPSGLTV
jgi:hypothetical protein